MKMPNNKRPICTGTSQLFDISMKLKKKWDAEGIDIGQKASEREAT